MTDPLTEIGTRLGTDKATWHGYTKYYHEILKDFRDDELFFLELGFGGYEWADTGGESVRMWAEYAPSWDIACLDIHPKNADLLPKGAKFYQGSQDDPFIIAEILGDYGPPTIIVDDASHVAPLTVASFKLLWPQLESGGWYIIEDIGTSYMHDYEGHDRGLGTPIEMSKNVIDNIMANSRFGRDQNLLAGIGNLGVDIMTVMPNAVGLRKK